MRKKPIRASGFAPENIPKELLPWIGELITHWGYIEFQLGVLIREGFNLSHKSGRVFTVGAGIKVLCASLKTMTHDDTWIKDKALRDDICALAGAVSKQVLDRHAYAHAVFGFISEEGKPDDEPKKFVRFLMKEKEHRINPDTEPVTKESLEELCEEAHNLGVDAQDLTVRLKRWKGSVGLRRPDQ